MPAAASSSRFERHSTEDRYARDYSSKRRRSSPVRAEHERLDDRYDGGSRHRSRPDDDDGYSVKYTSSHRGDGLGTHSYRSGEPARRPSSPSWKASQRYEADSSHRHRADDRAREHSSSRRKWGRSPSPGWESSRGGSSRDYSDATYDDRHRRPEPHWKRADTDRRHSPEPRWKFDGEPRRSRSRRPERDDHDERIRGRMPSRSRSRSRDRDHGHVSSGRREAGWNGDRRHLHDHTPDRSSSRARRPSHGHGSEMPPRGEDGELERTPRAAEPRQADEYRRGLLQSERTGSQTDSLQNDRFSRTHGDRTPFGAKPPQRSGATISDSLDGLSQDTPGQHARTSSLQAEALASMVTSSSAHVVGHGPSPRGRAELRSPLDHSSPSHGGASTPRPDMPSPATTVDSKASAPADDAKAVESSAPAADSSRMHDPRAGHAPTGQAGWRRVTGERNHHLDSGSVAMSGLAAVTPMGASSPIPIGPRALRASAQAAATMASASREAVTDHLASRVESSLEGIGPEALPEEGPASTAAASSAAVVQPEPRSFGHVPLPSELEDEVRAQNFIVAYDPIIERGKHKDKGRGGDKDRDKGKQPVHQEKPPPSSEGRYTVADPRLTSKHRPTKPGPHGRRTLHRRLIVLSPYQWDKYSSGPRPPPPPRELVITGLSPRTAQGQLTQQFRAFGRIESVGLKLDPQTGQSLGICSIVYAHDYDEDGQPTNQASAGLALQRGHVCAQAALKAMHGARINGDIVTVVLDRGQVKYKAAYRGEIAARIQAQRDKAAAAAKVSASQQAQGPAHGSSHLGTAAPTSGSLHNEPSPLTASTKDSMRPPAAPRGPRSSLNRGPATASPYRSSPLQRSAWDSEASESPQLRGSMARSWRDESSQSRRDSGDSFDHRRPRFSETSSSSHRPREQRRRQDDDELEEDHLREEPTERILRRLSELQNPYVCVARPNTRSIVLADLREHFSAFSPALILADDRAFYIGFGSSDAAARARWVLEKRPLRGYQVDVVVKDAPDSESIRKEALASKALATGDEPPTAADLFRRRRGIMTQATASAAEADKAEYTPSELADATFALLQKELVDHLKRTVRSKLVTPLVMEFLKPSAPGGRLMSQATQQPASGVHPTIDALATDTSGKLPSFRKVPATILKKADLDFDIPKRPSAGAPDEDAKRGKKAGGSSKPKKVRHAAEESDGASSDDGQNVGRRAIPSTKVKRDIATESVAPNRQKLPTFSDDEPMPDEPQRSVSASVEPSEAKETPVTLATKAKTSKKTAPKKKKAIKLDEVASVDSRESTPAVTKSASAAKKGKVAKAASESPLPADMDPFSMGLVEDDEDLYYIKLALERHQEGLPITESGWPAAGEDDEEAESAQPAHHTGSARTEGFYRIPAAEKAAHLPDRNSTKTKQEQPSTHALASARNNRADSRRLVLGIEQHKRETATDTDIFKINQLRTRKKQLKFAKSPIHDWGLYAMEKILPGDMVIEYVGEVVRQQVADEREKQYERQGNFSTYLFRVDDDLVVDATHKGNIARLMNHCCVPNCSAKILTLNGEKRIVLFARTVIEPGNELTYDYKFQASADDEDAIACLCGSPGCRRYL